MPTTNDLATLMGKWPLNSTISVAATHRKWGKAADGTSTQVATCMINKWRAKINEKEIYNVRNPPGKEDQKIGFREDGYCLYHLGKPLKPSTEEIIRITSPRIKPKDKVSRFSPRICHSIYLRSCLIVAILTKAQFLNPCSTNSLYWASWA